MNTDHRNRIGRLPGAGSVRDAKPHGETAQNGAGNGIEQAITALRQMAREIEWEYPLDARIAIDKAIEIIASSGCPKEATDAT